MEEGRLTKKEKRFLAKQKKQEERTAWARRQRLVKLGALVVFLILLFGAGFWLYREALKPRPGIAVPDMGRDHVPDGTVVDYNSNPPTSGPHFEEWTPAGIYNAPVSDGHLIHSLEHGYVIISYNCLQKVSSLDSARDKQVPQVPRVSQAFAHGEELPATPAGELEGDVWQSLDCTALKEQLSQVAQANRLWKIIVIPRPGLDTRIALTAWTRIDKFDQFDQERIESFIRAFRNKGPEKTPD